MGVGLRVTVMSGGVAGTIDSRIPQEVPKLAVLTPFAVEPL
jgi:hypothetical protein